MEAIIRQLRRGERGVSNVIVVMLSLVLIVVIVSNVVLWSYQMNQFDWERMQEEVEIVDVRSGTSFSQWFVAECEYTIDVGSGIDGSYTDTQSAEDGSWQTLREEGSPGTPRYRLFMNGTFTINMESHPLTVIQTVDILLKYNASDTGEKFYLKAYNWTAREYGYDGFNDTSGSQPVIPGAWIYYSVNLTDHWRSYVRDNGLMYIQILDEKPESPSGNKTQISIDFLGVRVKGNWTSFTLSNRSALTVHIVSLWIINATRHLRYDVDIFLTAGERLTYIRADMDLPSEDFLVKIVTERGNMAVLVCR